MGSRYAIEWVDGARWTFHQFTTPATYWLNYHGAALAAVALMGGRLLDLCLIAASDNYRELPPLDRIPCWTTVVYREPGVRPRRHGGDCAA